MMETKVQKIKIHFFLGNNLKKTGKFLIPDHVIYIISLDWGLFSSIVQKNKNTKCSSNAHLSGAIILLKYLVKKRHNSKIIAFRVMLLVLQLHLVMMSNYSKFVVDIFNIFWVMGYINGLAQQPRRWQQQRFSDHNSLTFSLKILIRNN